MYAHNTAPKLEIAPQRPLFLMAEDDSTDAELFAAMINLAFAGEYGIVRVDSYKKIVEELSRNEFHALFLDMGLPDQSGVDNIQQIVKKYPNLPIVVLTGTDDLDIALTSLKKGAQDYLSKNKVTPEILARSVQYAAERKQVEQRLKDALDNAATRATQLEAQAKHDALTGLANRAYFEDAASRILHRAKRFSQKVALLYFDLNGFKKINDTYGHLAGDDLLKQVANRLQSTVRDTDFLARLGGDEFVIITDILAVKEQVYALVKRIEKQFDLAFKISGHELQVNTSIGVAFYPEATALDTLVKQADCAMYEAKLEAGTHTCFFSEQIASQYSRSQKVEANLAQAITDEEIFANFQPIWNVNSPGEVHFEALARWNSAAIGGVNPNEFIPIAENSPAINNITKAIAMNAHKLFSHRQQETLKIDKFSLNITAHQLSSRTFASMFIDWLQQLGLPTSCICLELTERQAVENISECKERLDFLQEKGFEIALDDFGSGFSSVTHLLELPFNTLKVDRMLIRDIDTNSRNQAIVAGIVEMAHRLNMKVVAEGIEREEEKRKAVELGCDSLQGYIISKPLSFSEALEYGTGKG